MMRGGRAKVHKARRVDHAGEEERKRIESYATKHAKGLLSKLRKLRTFYIVNRDIANLETWTPTDVVREWGAQAMTPQENKKGYSPKTVGGWTRDVRKHNIDPMKPEETEARLKNYIYMNGLKRAAMQEPPGNRRELRSVRELLRACHLPFSQRVGTPRPDEDAWLDRQVAWYVCVATGCRPSHIWGIIDAFIDETALYVQWGTRKYRSACRAHLRYLYCWSAPPPEHVRARLAARGLQALHRVGNGKPGEQSGPLLRWLQAASQDRGMVTGHARTRMTHILRHLVDVGRISELLFEELMDHQVKASFRHYRVVPR